MVKERDAQIIAEPLNPSELEEALAMNDDDRTTDDWNLIELAAEKWLSGHDAKIAETETVCLNAIASKGNK